MSTAMESVQSLLKNGMQREKSWYDELEEEVCEMCPELTLQQRVMGCIACFSLGFLMSLGSLFKLIELVKGNPVPFAMTYTLGNIVAICSSCFLSGPKSQATKMFKGHRLLATLMYLLSIGLTLIVTFTPNVPERVLLVLLCIIIQFVALAWYTLSWIPFARDAVAACCKTCVRKLRFHGIRGSDFDMV